MDLAHVERLDTALEDAPWRAFMESTQFISDAKEVQAAQRTKHLELMAGWLKKKPSSMSLSRWNRRWFILFPDALVYYSAPDKREEKGRMPLTTLSVCEAPGFGINFEYGDGHPSRLIQCETAKDQARWLEALKQAIAAVAHAARTESVARPLSSPGSVSGSPGASGGALRRYGSSGDTGTQPLGLTVVCDDEERSLRILCATHAELELWYTTLSQLIVHQSNGKRSLAQLAALAKREDPAAALPCVLLAMARVRAGDLETARAELDLALAREPMLPLANVEMARVCRDLGDLEAADSCLQTAVLCSKGQDTRILYEAASVEMDTGRLEACVEHIQHLLSLDPYHVDAHMLLMRVLTVGKDSEKLQEFVTSLGESTDFKWAHVNVGLCLEAMNKLDQAVAHYERAIAVDHKLVPALYNLAAVLRRKGGRESLRRAAALLQQVVELSPDMVPAWLALVDTHTRAENSAAALSAANRALRIPDISRRAAAHFVHAKCLVAAACAVQPRDESYLLQAIEALNVGMECPDAGAAWEAKAMKANVLCLMDRASEAVELLDDIDAHADDIFARKESAKLRKQIVDAQAPAGASAAAAPGPAARAPAARSKAHRPSVAVEFLEAGLSTEQLQYKDLSAQERSAQFFKHMREEKVRTEQAAAQQLQERLQAMTDEEREAWEAEQAQLAKQERKKERMVRGQLTSYAGKSAKAAVRGRGRGRGRARGR